MHLEHVLGSDTRIKVLRTLFQDALPQLDTVALAKETGKSRAGVANAVQELLATRVILAHVRGRTSFYAADPDHGLYATLAHLFREERFRDNVPHLFPTYWNHLEAVVSRVVGFAPVQAVVLFGSFARGPIYPTADVDLLLVTTTGKVPWVGPQSVLGHAVQFVALSPNSFSEKVRSGDAFVTGLLERHVVLFQAGSYEWPWRRETRFQSGRSFF